MLLYVILPALCWILGLKSTSMTCHLDDGARNTQLLLRPSIGCVSHPAWAVHETRLTVDLALTNAQSYAVARWSRTAEEVYPEGSWVWRAVSDVGKSMHRYHTEAYDYNAPYWTIRYREGDWEKLNRGKVAREVEKEKLDKNQHLPRESIDLEWKNGGNTTW